MSNAKERKPKDRVTVKPNFIEHVARFVAKARIERFLKRWEIELTEAEKENLTTALAKCLLNNRGEKKTAAGEEGKEYCFVNSEARESALCSENSDLIVEDYFVGSDGEDSKC